jgi:tRNA threonylcarbamoyladenosine biosynthesis protein TsaB
MKVLGIETATAVCSVALVESGGASIERSINSKQMHSEKILFLIDDCLAERKTTLRSVDGIAVSIGPGSFTGLRIGLSVAKGLAYSSGLPICGIPTLLALARQGSSSCTSANDCIILPMIDARRDEVYCAVYRLRNGKMIEINPPCSAFLNTISPLITSHEKVIVLGDGAKKFKEYCEKTAFNKSSSYIFPVDSMANCSAIPVAELGARRFKSAEYDPVASLEPLYIKEFYTPVKTVK